LLQAEFPGLPMLTLAGYGVTYSRSNLLMHLALQWPQVQRAISAEHKWLQQQVLQHGFDMVISDNRYGLWSPHCHCVFMTHQLQPALPNGLGLMQGLVRRKLYRYINRFHECWVPDYATGAGAISGALGHPQHLPAIPVKYMGWLTRFSMPALMPTSFRYKLLVLLSGPEPQRSILENMLLHQLAAWPMPVLMVRGLPGATASLEAPAHVEIFDHLPAAELEAAFLQAEFILSRGGYSTLMDAFTLQKKCIVIPTPGQTEQEYLGRELHAKGAALCFAQSGFDLAAAMKAAEMHAFQLPHIA
jgi:hypothetical protein